MSSNAFETIALKYNKAFMNFKFCPDQFIGQIEVSGDNSSNPASNKSGNDFQYRTNLNDEFIFNNDNKKIILILESPHKSEFADGSPKPAAGNNYGDTGRAIRQLFSEACSVHKHLQPGTYNLVIMNAIQYQCSLGCIKKYRDNVFIDSWNRFAKENFKSRLSKIFTPDDLVVNACTSGRKKKLKLNILVQEAINEFKPKKSLTIFHPSMWQLINNYSKKHSLIANYQRKL